MASTTIIGAVQEFLEGCPLLKDKIVNIDYLPADTKMTGMQFSVSAIPSSPVDQAYVGTTSRQVFAFALSSVNDYGPDEIPNMDNSGLYEGVARWLKQQTVAMNLPELPEGMRAYIIEASSQGYLYNNEETSAHYQIQGNLYYVQSI